MNGIIKMKKIFIVIITLFIMIPLINLNAATITEAEFANGRIIVKGTGEGEVQIVIFGFDKLPLYMTTTTVEEDGTFSITLPEIEELIEDKTYTIKVSDYDGTNVSTRTFNEVEVPQTSDDIVWYIIMGSVCLVGISIFIYKVNRKIQKK